MALTRTTTQVEDITVSKPLDAAFACVLAACEKVGKVKASQPQFGRIVLKVGSGALNMNRTDVTIVVEGIDADHSKLTFTAIAQEGMVSQQTSAKAVTRILDAM